jgi:hypothetical protein
MLVPTTAVAALRRALAIGGSVSHVGPLSTVFTSVIVPLAERAGVDARLAAAPPRAGSCVAYVVGATAPLSEAEASCVRFGEPVALPEIAAAATSAPTSAMRTARVDKDRPVARENGCLTTDSPLLGL